MFSQTWQVALSSFLPSFSTGGAALSLMYGFINGGFTYFPRLNASVENWHVCSLIPSCQIAKAERIAIINHFLYVYQHVFNFVYILERYSNASLIYCDKIIRSSITGMIIFD